MFEKIVIGDEASQNKIWIDAKEVVYLVRLKGNCLELLLLGKTIDFDFVNN